MGQFENLAFRLFSVLLTAGILLLGCTNCSIPPPTGPGPACPAPMDLLDSRNVDSVVLGQVVAEVGEERNDSTATKIWRVEIYELIIGETRQPDSILVGIEYLHLREPHPTTGVLTGLPTPYATLARGEQVLLFLTHSASGQWDFVLADPFAGKWLAEDGMFRCDNPRFAVGQQLRVSVDNVLGELRGRAIEAGRDHRRGLADGVSGGAVEGARGPEASTHPISPSRSQADTRGRGMRGPGG